MTKYKIEDIRLEAEQQDWHLISSEYKNLDSKLEYQCPKGHTVFTTYKRIRDKYLCPVCKEFRNTTDMEIFDKAPQKKRNVCRVLALDQSTKVTGYAIFDDDKLIHYGSIEIEDKFAPARMSKLREWIRHVIEVWKPDIVAIEDIQLQSNAQEAGVQGILTYRVLAELIGVLETFFYENNINYQLVHVSSWRNSQQVKGKHRSDKKRSAELKIEKCYGLIVTDDVADAILIGRYIVEKNKEHDLIEWE